MSNAAAQPQARLMQTHEMSVNYNCDMCGIFYLSTKDQQSGEAVSEAIKKLRHRGPDSSTVWANDKHTIGFHRLAIINTSETGNQPFQQGSKIAVCNGQIYNYKSLASSLGVKTASLRSDCDIVLKLLDKYSVKDPELWLQLDGDFAGVVVDLDTDEVCAYRDPVGVRPLFYGVDTSGTVICFASEAKAIHALDGVAKVRVFPPGHYYVSSTGKFENYTRVYEPDETVAPHDSRTAALNIKKLLISAVLKRVEHTERPLAFLCSGGLDSSLVVDIAQKLLESGDRSKDMHAFCIEYSDSGSQSADSFYAKFLLQQAGIQHTVVSYDSKDIFKSLPRVVDMLETYDPNTIRAAIPMYMLAKYIREKTDYKILLSGEFADELFAGYNYFRLVPNGDAVTNETKRLVRNIHMFDCLRADRCFAAHGLEVRVPFADRDLLRYVFSLSGDLKKPQNGVEKALLRQSFGDSNLLLQTRVLDRTKERMSDGCGFSYVPHLLSMINPAGGDLSKKQKNEKALYESMFVDTYGLDNKDWIITRSLPDWAQLSDQKDQLLAA